MRVGERRKRAGRQYGSEGRSSSHSFLSLGCRYQSSQNATQASSSQLLPVRASFAKTRRDRSSQVDLSSPRRRLVREHLAALAAMAAPTIALPPSNPGDPLPDLPQELLLTLLTKRAASDGPEKERDALDAFVLSGAANGGDGNGGVQVEDVLNELLPDGACPSPRPHRSQREVGRRTEPTLLSCAQKRV